MESVIWMAAASVLTGLFVGRTARREGRPVASPADARPAADSGSASDDAPSPAAAADDLAVPPPPPPPEPAPSAGAFDVFASIRRRSSCGCACPRTETCNRPTDVACHAFGFGCGPRPPALPLTLSFADTCLGEST